MSTSELGEAVRREEILMKAAAKLQERADDLQMAHAITSPHGVAWHENYLAEKTDHDECVELAAGLLAMARAA